MADNPHDPFSDSELLTLYKTPHADLNLLSPDELSRLDKLTSAPEHQSTLGKAGTFLGAIADQNPILAGAHKLLSGAVDTVRKNPVGAAATAGGIGAALLTDGASIPLQAAFGALGGAGGAGTAIGARQLATGKPEPAGATAATMGREGATQGIAGGIGGAVGKGVSAVGDWVGSKAVPLVLAGLKPTITQLRQQAGASMTGLEPQAQRMANIILENGWTKAAQPAAAIKQIEGNIQRIVTDATQNGVMMPGAAGPATPLLDTATRVPRYLDVLTKKASMQAMPSADVAAIRGAGKDVMNGPLAQDVRQTVAMPGQSLTGAPTTVNTPLPVTRALRANVTPEEGLDVARGTSKWANKKQWGELKGAETEASKTVERAVRDSTKDALPEIAPLLREQKDALTVHPVLDRMEQRMGNRDAISLPAWAMAAGATGAPARAVAGTVANLASKYQLPAGVAASKLGPKLMQRSGATGQISADVLRAALLSLMDGESNHQ